MKDFIKILILSFLSIVFLPHLLFYEFSKARGLIDEDLLVIKKRWGVNFPLFLSLIYVLLKNKYYRNIFYTRLGRLSCMISWYLPGERTFFPCENIGGGVYPAHPFATVLNAKSIGKNFSFRQCTTLGNKKDGDGTAIGPIIGDNVTLGANVCIIGDVKVGNNVIVGAGSVVVKDIPDNVVVAGNPARIISN